MAILTFRVAFVCALAVLSLVHDSESFPDIATLKAEVEETTLASLYSSIEAGQSAEKLASRQFPRFGKPHDVFPVTNASFKVLPVVPPPFNNRIVNGGGGGGAPKPITSVLAGTKRCRCGYKVTQTIIGGTAANILNYSWMAAIIDADTHKLFCGGSLITDRHVLTASHCVQAYRRTPQDLYVQLRQPNITEEILQGPQSKASVRAYIKEIIMHERYNGFTIDNDIAILVLKAPLRIGDQSLVPVCLPTTNNQDYAGREASIVGWGTESEAQQEPVANLQHVHVPVMSNYDCVTKTDTHHYAGKVNDNMMCAGYLDGRKDACQGDSGGPLTVTENDSKVQVGIVSWGVGCARPRSPGVYARVGRYVSWIQSKIQGGLMCNNKS